MWLNDRPTYHLVYRKEFLAYIHWLIEVENKRTGNLIWLFNRYDVKIEFVTQRFLGLTTHRRHVDEPLLGRIFCTIGHCTNEGVVDPET